MIIIELYLILIIMILLWKDYYLLTDYLSNLDVLVIDIESNSTL